MGRDRGRLRELSAALGLLTALLVTVLVAALVISHDLSTRARRAYVESAIPARTTVKDLVLQMVNQETGVRGFVITGRESSLQPYVRGRIDAAADLATLKRLVRRTPSLDLRLDRAERQIAGLDRFFGQQIDRMRRGSGVHGLARSEIERGAALFEAFRSTAAGMTAATDAFVARTDEEQAERYHTLVLLLLIVGSLAVLIAAALTVLVPRRTARLAAERTRLLEEERAARSRLSDTLEEVASLNRTLRRMVQTDPLFSAHGTLEEVAEEVCREAREIFEAPAAALWSADGNSIELVHRSPPVSVFPPQARIEYADHPTFEIDMLSGRPRFIADLEREEPAVWRDYASSSEARSQLRLPLASAGSASGLLILSWPEPRERLSEEESAVVARFADQAAVALAEAERREARRAAGALHAQLERGLLPSIELRTPDASAVTLYRPGDERLNLGGDFYDCVELPDDSIAMLIGDVAGHGPAAAALGASLRAGWRTLALAGGELEGLVAGLQELFVRERAERSLFATAIVARIDPARSELCFVSAGHPAPIVLGGEPATEDRNGPPVGIAEQPVWRATRCALGPAATIVLYTDGLVEGRRYPGSAERMGVEPIRQMLEEASPGAVTEAALRELVELATVSNGAGLVDDVALLALNVGIRFSRTRDVAGPAAAGSPPRSGA
jgi:serine phosphatase RsbU (regulator of sigma subunit)/CHASE3 domain sensor protein